MFREYKEVLYRYQRLIWGMPRGEYASSAWLEEVREARAELNRLDKEMEHLDRDLPKAYKS